MKCSSCGRELKEGTLVCECGQAVGEEKAGGETKTPDGRDLASLEKPAVTSRTTNVLIVCAMAVVIGIIAFFVYKMIIGRELTDEKGWKKFETDSFSITMPDVLKESDKISESDPDYTRLGFYTSEKIAVYITKASLNDEEKAVIKKSGVDAVKKNMISQGAKQTIGGQPLDPKELGDAIYVEFAATKDGYIEVTDLLWEVDATIVTEQALYEVEIYCPEVDKDIYRESMLKWLESFEAKDK